MAPPIAHAGTKETDFSIGPIDTSKDTTLQAPVTKPAFGFQRLTLDTALFTDQIRKGFEATTVFPEGLFFGPMTTDVTVKGRADWGWMDAKEGPSFFTSFGGGKFKTDGASNASGYFLQAGFGIVRNKPARFGVGDEKYNFGVLGGIQTLGLGLSLYNFDQVSGTPVVRLDAIDEAPFLHAKLGDFHFGLKLFTSQSGVNFAGLPIDKCEGKYCSTQDYVPASSIEPLSFTLSYDFNSTPVEAKDRTSLYPGEAYITEYDFAVRRFGSHLTLQKAGQLVDTRVLLEAAPQGSVDSPKASSLARWALNLYQAKTSITYGGIAADLEFALLRANDQEKWIIGAGEVASTLGLCIHAVTGKSGDDYASDFAGRASKIACANNLEAQGLGFLGGFGLLGKPNGDSTDKAVFWTTHGVFLVVGVVGLINYWRPFGKDPDSIAYNGGTGIIDPLKMEQDMDNRLLLGTLLTTPMVYSINSYLNLKDFKVGIAPTDGGAMGTATGSF